MFVDVVAEDARQHFIQLIAVPPAVHVGLAHTQSPLPEDPVEKALVVHANIPSTRAVDFHIATGEQFVDRSLVGKTPAHRRMVAQYL